MFDANSQTADASVTDSAPEPDGSRMPRIVFNQIELLLSEKRTALSLLRTGIAVFALPLSVLSVLVATSSYYDVLSVLSILLPLLLLCLVLVILGGYLVVRAIVQFQHYDRLIINLKAQHSRLSQLVD
ncbi:MAG: hypothetical protein H6R01_545 [Burkholderiaceae bacterium]|nr:hypothetical protein [Burkholderiaceae bacterium]